MKTQTNLRALFIAAIFLFLGGKSMAQTFVNPQQISTDNISTFLTNNNYEIQEKTQSYLKINKAHGTRYFFLDLKDNNRYIMFNVAYKLQEGTSKEKIDDYLRKANNLDVIKVKYFEKGNDIQIEYYFWIKQGFTYESLLDAVNEYSLYIEDCLNADKEKILI